MFGASLFSSPIGNPDLYDDDVQLWLDISKGLARQFSDLRLSITTTRFMDDETQFEEDNGTRLIKMKVGGISYLALFRFRSSVWYILNLQEGRVISTEDAEYRVLLDALGVR
ncbi:hypothetical protein J15TS10_30950 [Paenibacillus woosongensis]|uniref:Uncharacterized protein n=1 Tax=Paenibacillus woosongensis TaxID=307580 RepID=A0ABQ4MTN6_9BACL|nr:hypothetical protein J15TS10_30950 [Paenibacillus woosongensis]